MRDVGPTLLGTAHTLAFSPDGRTLATIHLPNAVKYFRLVPPGTSIPAADLEATARLWRWPDLGPVRRLELSPTPDGTVESDLLRYSNGPVPLAFSPDGRTLALEWRGEVVVAEVLTGRPRRRFAGHAGSLVGLHFTPDGRQLVSASHDGTAVVWDLTHPADGRPPDQLWDALASDDAAKADAAIWALVATPARALPLLRLRLRPDRVDHRQIAAWLADLSGPQFAKREAATKALRERGEPALPAIRQALASAPSPEARRRLERLAKECQSPMPTGTELQALRAVEVLGKIGTPAARELLATLADGSPDAPLTQEAAALKRPR